MRHCYSTFIYYYLYFGVLNNCFAAFLRQDENDLDTGSQVVARSAEADKDVSGETDGAKILLLFKIVQALRMRNENPGLYRGYDSLVLIHFFCLF